MRVGCAVMRHLPSPSSSAVVLVLALAAAASCTKGGNEPATTTSGASGASGTAGLTDLTGGDMKDMGASGLRYRDLVVGTGPALQRGATARLQFVARLPDGTQFDSSAKHGAEYPYTYGAGAGVRFFEEGL